MNEYSLAKVQISVITKKQIEKRAPLHINYEQGSTISAYEVRCAYFFVSLCVNRRKEMRPSAWCNGTKKSGITTQFDAKPVL